MKRSKFNDSQIINIPKEAQGSASIKKWALRQNIELVYTQPGNPQQNAYVERYNRTVRYDWLSQDLFENIEEVQEKATSWLWYYNNERPNMALWWLHPRAEATCGCDEHRFYD